MSAQLGQWLGYALIGFTLMIVVEGMIYAIFPEGMKKLLTRMLDVPASTMRSGGLVAVIAGLGLLWLVAKF